MISAASRAVAAKRGADQKTRRQEEGEDGKEGETRAKRLENALERNRK